VISCHSARPPLLSVAVRKSVLKTTKGVDDPERLKRFLYNAWRTENLKYVLLAGDVDVLPVRYMALDRVTPAAFDYAFYPSDLYYSDLAKQDGSFDDWNGKKDGFHAHYFGEVRGEKNKKDPINFDEIDYRPDVAVGRWPVSTPEEVRALAAKSMAYEKSILDGTHPGMRQAALFHVGGWVDARPRLDGIAKGLPRGWTAERFFYSNNNPQLVSAVGILSGDEVHAVRRSDAAAAAAGCGEGLIALHLTRLLDAPQETFAAHEQLPAHQRRGRIHAVADPVGREHLQAVAGLEHQRDAVAVHQIDAAGRGDR